MKERNLNPETCIFFGDHRWCGTILDIFRSNPGFQERDKTAIIQTLRAPRT